MPEVIEEYDFLTKEELYTLTDWDSIPVYLLDSANQSNKEETYYDSASFAHNIVPRWKGFGESFRVNSPLYNPIYGILKRFCIKKGIELSEVYRCTLNITVNIPDEFIADAHIDHPFPHRLAIIYLNDSDGNTVLFDKHSCTKDRENASKLKVIREIKPSKGKIISLKDGRTFHTARPCTRGSRAVIVITYI